MIINSNICKYYPCHDLSSMSCVICYCPLYHDNNCEGNIIILPNGIKDCSNCTLPHTPAGYEYIVRKLQKNIDNPK
jgi:Zn-finger protein